MKTRLAEGVGAEMAAQIYRKMVALVFRNLPPDVDVIACFDPAERRAEIESWLAEIPGGNGIRYLAQSGGDLGERLERAFTFVFSLGFERVAVIGTDCLEIDAAIFQETWTALGRKDVVLGPTEDGGYYLMALSKPCPALFRGISWSTDKVLAESRAAAERENLSVHLLPVRIDVDCEEDWRRAREQINSTGPLPRF